MGGGLGSMGWIWGLWGELGSMGWMWGRRFYGANDPPLPPPSPPPPLFLSLHSDPWAPPLPPPPMAPPLPATPPLVATPLPATPPLSLLGAGGGGGEEGEVRLRPLLAFAPAAVARLLEGLGGAQRRAHEVGARLAARGGYLGGGGSRGGGLGLWGSEMGLGEMGGGFGVQSVV